MPEGPEVCRTAELIDAKFNGRLLTRVNIIAGRYLKSLPTGFAEFISSLPLILKQTRSVGKFLWMEFDGWAAWWTLGLTGNFCGQYPRIQLQFDAFEQESELVFGDQLSYGTVKFSRDLNALQKKVAGLRPDALRDEDLQLARYQHSKCTLAGLLLNQKLVSGIGNYLCCEILRRAELSPWRVGNSLTDSELQRLDNCIKWTCTLAFYRNNLGYWKRCGFTPSTEQLYHPEINLGDAKFTYWVYGQSKDPDGNPVISQVIADGRTAWWAPAVQH